MFNLLMVSGEFIVIYRILMNLIFLKLIFIVRFELIYFILMNMFLIFRI